MKPHVLSLATLFSLSALLGCGATKSQVEGQGRSQPDFSLIAAPSAITAAPGGAAQAITVLASPLNGFTGSVIVAVGSLPAGITATPSSLSLAAGAQGQISISASSTATPGTANIALTGTSGTLMHNAAISLAIATPVTTASLSTSAFNFGNNLVNNMLTQTVAVVTNTGPAVLIMNPSLTGDSSYSIAPATTCTQQLAPQTNCSIVVNYAPAAPSVPAAQSATLNMGFGDVPAGTPQTVAITGVAASLPF